MLRFRVSLCSAIFIIIQKIPYEAWLLPVLRGNASHRDAVPTWSIPQSTHGPAKSHDSPTIRKYDVRYGSFQSEFQYPPATCLYPTRS